MTVCAADDYSRLCRHSLRFPKLTVLKAQGLTAPSVSNLTSLTLHGLCEDYRVTSQIFRASPGLKYLNLYDLLPLMTPLPQTALIRADSLCSLAVSIWSQPAGEAFTYIFNYLAMPNIKYLELDGGGWKTSDFGQSLSSAKIDTLRISNRSDKSFDANTINFLYSFSTVRYLQLIRASTRGLLSQNALCLAHNNSSNFPTPSQPNNVPTNSNVTAAVQQEQSVFGSVWPDLHIITLDKLTAGNLLDLSDFITSRQDLQIVELSTLAGCHLSSSLRRSADGGGIR